MIETLIILALLLSVPFILGSVFDRDMNGRNKEKYDDRIKLG